MIGNSILNRAFYGIMGNTMLRTSDGTYTNAVYGFLSIMFKIMEDEKPDYLVVSFDVKHPTKRHEMYSEYKGNRKGMPDELAAQMPIMKNVLKAMNIKIIEKEGYEADDVLGTLSVWASKQNIQTILLTGDRDSFQLAKNNVTIKIPRTKQGKTEYEDFDEQHIYETYGVSPKQMIEVKGLMGDSSDNIPGVAGIGEKTAFNLIKKYGSIDNIYKAIDENDPEIKGKQKENLIANKEMAYLSRTLGTIDLDAPIEKSLDEFKVEQWNNQEVLEIFKELRFKRFIDRFDLENSGQILNENKKDLFEIIELNNENEIQELKSKIYLQKEMCYYFELKDSDELIINQKIEKIHIYLKSESKVFIIKFDKNEFKDIFENDEILKCGYDVKNDYILLKQNEINPQNIMFDVKIAMYLLNSGTNMYSLEEVAKQMLEIDIEDFYKDGSNDDCEQTSLFEAEEKEEVNKKIASYAYVIGKSKEVLEKKLEEANELELFKNIEMPCSEILAEMKYTGVYAEKDDIQKMSEVLKVQIEDLSKEIYEIVGEEFNINSPKQLGVILFEKLELPCKKKTKSGYSTDVDTLEKIRYLHPVVEKVLEYRQVSKINSTFVEGMIPYINSKTNRIHTTFHQTVAATGRLSSSDPNLQNIPTRTDLGKEIRKLFKAEDGKVFIDADYSQIELRVLAHMSGDKKMTEAFNTNEDIHKMCASEVFGVPLDEVTKEMRSHAKAVNFGIVYGISDFGLSEQLKITKKDAQKYIDTYLEKYNSIQEFMENEKNKAKECGYVETIYHRRRYIPELKSNNYMVRQFGERAAMNAPVQGTAADIMKIAMIDVYNELKKRKLKSKIVLQIHDELIIEAEENEQNEVKDLLQNCMQNAVKLNVPLDVEANIGKSWYDAK